MDTKKESIDIPSQVKPSKSESVLAEKRQDKKPFRKISHLTHSVYFGQFIGYLVYIGSFIQKQPEAFLYLTILQLIYVHFKKNSFKYILLIQFWHSTSVNIRLSYRLRASLS